MAINIHSTAIIADDAIINDGASIGAYCVIGKSVTIGKNCVISNHANIKGCTTLGDNNKIFPFASIGEEPQDKKYCGENTRLIIGNNNTIREFCTINTGTVQGGGVTKIGDNNWIMAYTHIAHDCIVGNNIIFANNAALSGHVTIHDWVIIGGYAMFHQFVVIGAHAMISGGSRVTQDVPPYVLAQGFRTVPKFINIEGLKRRNFTSQQIENIKSAYSILYKMGLTYTEAKHKISELASSQTELKVFNDFFALSQRGIIRE